MPEGAGDLDQHAAIGSRHRRLEDRRMDDAGVLGHLGHMLVREVEAIVAERGAGVIRRVRILELGDHRLAAARIARDRVDGQRMVVRHQACADQRADEREEAGGIAARIGNSRRLGDLGRLAGLQFGKAIGPAIGHAMRARGVDHADLGGPDHLHRLARGVIGQAKDHEVRRIERILALRGVLAVLVAQDDLLDPVAAVEPLADFQARGAHGAVDEDPNRHAAGRSSIAAGT